MKIVCLTVGKKHEAVLAAAIDKYQTRLQPYVDFDFEYVPASDKQTESDKLIKRLKEDDVVILLDETGIQITNPALSELLGDSQNQSTKRIVVVVGGAFGVEQNVFERANHILSLSKLVFPHQIVRLLVVEQLYRSFNLLAGGKYHHE